MRDFSEVQPTPRAINCKALDGLRVTKIGKLAADLERSFELIFEMSKLPVSHMLFY